MGAYVSDNNGNGEGKKCSLFLSPFPHFNSLNLLLWSPHSSTLMGKGVAVSPRKTTSAKDPLQNSVTIRTELGMPNEMPKKRMMLGWCSLFSRKEERRDNNVSSFTDHVSLKVRRVSRLAKVTKQRMC